MKQKRNCTTEGKLEVRYHCDAYTKQVNKFLK